MKSPVLLSLSGLFLVLFFVATVAATPPPNEVFEFIVRDTFQDFMLSNNNKSRYFVMSGVLLGGGVRRGVNGELVMAPDVLDFGETVLVEPKKPNLETQTVLVETPIVLRFFTGDDDNSVWKVEGYPGPGPYYLSSKGKKGEATSWFQVKKFNYYAYDLAFCPETDTCYILSTEDVEGQKRLVMKPYNTFSPIVFFLDETPLEELESLTNNGESSSGIASM